MVSSRHALGFVYTLYIM